MAAQASVAVIGGGIIGSSVAYYLASMGVEGIVLLEKGSLRDNDGSTSHAPGGLRTLTVSKFFTKLGIASRELYDQLPLAEPGQEQFFRTGFLPVASTAARFDSYQRIQEIGASLGVPSQLLSPEEAAGMIPLLDPSVIVGGMFSPTSGAWSPVYHSDDVVGWIASGEFGYSVGAFLAHAFVPEELTAPETRLRVRYTGQFFEGEVVKGPLWDPTNARLKA